MRKQEKMIKKLLIFLLFQFLLISCQTSAESNAKDLVLFEKKIESQGKQHRLVIKKDLTTGNKKRCDSPKNCLTATLEIVYFIDNEKEWDYEDKVKDCSYDITFDLFSSDIVFDVSNGSSNIIIAYEKLCSASLEPTVVSLVGYKNNKQYTIDSDDKTFGNKRPDLVSLLKKLISKRKTYFLDVQDEVIDNKKIDDSLLSWQGSFTFKVDGIVHMGETHRISQTFLITNSSCERKVKVDDQLQDTESCKIKSSSRDKLTLSSDGQEYLLTLKNKDSYSISGEGVYLINPPTERYKLIRSN